MIYFHKYCASKLEKFDLEKPRWVNICDWRKKYVHIFIFVLYEEPHLHISIYTPPEPHNVYTGATGNGDLTWIPSVIRNIYKRKLLRSSIRIVLHSILRLKSIVL